MTQSEQQLENQLLKQLQTLGFEFVNLHNKEDLIKNLKLQLEKFNKTEFSEPEFSRILNHLNKGDRFTKAKTFREPFVLKTDSEKTIWIKFFNSNNLNENIYQVTNQVTQTGTYTTRYDVTILINGFPAVQIELKRRGLEIKEAFNQIQRYHHQSFLGTLFDYVQVFVISNGVNTKYYANNPKQNFEQTFFWTDENNKKITKLDDFANIFLEKNRLAKFIAEYIVLAEAKKTSMVLRPYQYYALKAIEAAVRTTDDNGYIWHTTGSGKTLTSYKASQVLSDMPEIKKVLFVVDRKDLDIQTIDEFNSFSEGSVNGTDNTRVLVEQLSNKNTKLIVTTIQKLDIAIKRESYLKKFEYLKNEKIIIIFDECHRSQFGKTHANIKSFFNKAQLFGFTGTPIFAENNIGGATTKDVFGNCLHKYIITDAISDNNVLGFSVEYVGKYKQKAADTLDADIFAEEYVENINTKEILESEDRLNKITDYVLADWDRKTKKGKFNAIFAVSNIPVLKKYYNLLKNKKKPDFKIATIFTFQANEDESEDTFDLNFSLEPETFDTPQSKYSREFLEDCIKDYNKTFATNFSTDKFYNYYKDLQKRIKSKEVDLVLVVNMFLTGFDSKYINTLFIDKNLQYHGLIQAYSRTNRIFGSDKPHGNIVSFRNLKPNTDKALALFGDENAREIVFKPPFEEQKEEFNQKAEELLSFVPTPDSVNDLNSEQTKVQFVKSFRDLLRIKSSLETFTEFSFQDLKITEQEFYDFQSKYLDIYEEIKKPTVMKESILEDLDFEIELTVKDIINFDYIIMLIAGLRDISSEKIREKKKEDILKLFDRDVRLRKKKELIEEFINDNLPKIKENDSVEKVFEEYWNKKRSAEIENLAKSENIELNRLNELIADLLYTGKMPKRQEIINLLSEKPKFSEREGIIQKVKQTIERLLDVFEW